jgi:hypothetical protein
MTRPERVLFSAVVVGALTASSLFQASPANAADALNSAAKATSAVVAKTENAVKRAAKKADSAIQHGTRKAGAAVSKTAGKLGLPTVPASGAGKAPQTTPQSPH